jgi:hypothetical protein
VDPLRGLTKKANALTIGLMSIAYLRKWDVTPIEIALDLETPRLSDPMHLGFSGPAEPRVCLVAAFASTSQLKRIASAVARAVPARPPNGLRITPLTTRWASSPAQISVQPMPILLRLQSKLIQAIEPGVVRNGNLLSFGKTDRMDEAAERFIRDFIPSNALPVFEPSYAAAGTDAMDFKALGITIYHLSRRGVPELILAHWAYGHYSQRSLHLESGP